MALKWLKGEVEVVLPRLVTRTVNAVMHGSPIVFVPLQLCFFLALNERARLLLGEFIYFHVCTARHGRWHCWCCRRRSRKVGKCVPAVEHGITELTIGVLRIGSHEVKSTALDLLCVLTDCLSNADAAKELSVGG